MVTPLCIQHVSEKLFVHFTKSDHYPRAMRASVCVCARARAVVLPLERLTMFSKKVFCGATSPRFPPGIVEEAKGATGDPACSLVLLRYNGNSRVESLVRGRGGSW